MSNDRIGKFTPEKTIFPKFDIMGKPYNRPASTRHCANNQFVVVGNYPNGLVDIEIEKLGIARKLSSGKKKVNTNAKK